MYRGYWGIWENPSESDLAIYTPVVAYNWFANTRSQYSNGVEIETVAGKIFNSHGDVAEIRDSNNTTKAKIPVFSKGQGSVFPAFYFRVKSVISTDSYIRVYSNFSGSATGVIGGKSRGQGWIYFSRDCKLRLEAFHIYQFKITDLKIDGETFSSEITISRGWHFLESKSENTVSNFNSLTANFLRLSFLEGDEIFEGAPLDVVIVLPQIFLDLRTTYFYPSFLS